MVTVRLPESVIEVPVLAAAPNSPLGDPKQRWHPVGQLCRDPVRNVKEEGRLAWVRYAEMWADVDGIGVGCARPRAPRPATVSRVTAEDRAGPVGCAAD